jgi:hypothetical protein
MATLITGSAAQSVGNQGTDNYGRASFDGSLEHSVAPQDGNMLTPAALMGAELDTEMFPYKAFGHIITRFAADIDIYDVNDRMIYNHEDEDWRLQ